MKAMKAELKASGLTDEEILHKTTTLMKAFKREDPTATLAEYALASKQKNVALKQNNTSPKDFTLVIIIYGPVHLIRLPFKTPFKTPLRPSFRYQTTF